MSNKFTRFVKNNKNKLDILKSSLAIFLGIALIASFIYLAVVFANLTKKAITATSEGIEKVEGSLEIVDNGLDNISKSFGTINDSLTTVKGYISDLEPIFSTVGDIVGTSLVNFAEQGQSSLKAAAEGSKIIDDTLILLSKVPLLNFNYAPKKTLNESLTELSTTFEALPESLSDLEKGLDTSTDKLEIFEKKVSDFGENIDALNTTMTDGRATLGNFRQRLDTIQLELPNTERKIIIGISAITVVLCLIVLVWLFGHVYTLIIAREGLISDRIAKTRRPEA